MIDTVSKAAPPWRGLLFLENYFGFYMFNATRPMDCIYTGARNKTARLKQTLSAKTASDPMM